MRESSESKAKDEPPFWKWMCAPTPLSRTFTSLLVVFGVILALMSYNMSNMINKLSSSSFMHRNALSVGEDFALALKDYYTLEQDYGAVSVSKVPLQSFLGLGTQDWMSLLPDDTVLSEISIPGTHDTIANVGSIFCETQDWSLLDQLEAGIRFLDIRCRPSGDRFAIHHGACFLHRFFEDVYEDVRLFLEGHASETILMRIKDEYVPTKDALPFEEIWNLYMDERGFEPLFVRNISAVPTLGAVRGQVVVLSDEPGPRTDSVSTSYGLPFLLDRINDIQDKFRISSNEELNQKAELILSYMEKAYRQPEGLTINHLSGTGVPQPGYFPREVAQRTNAVAFDLLGQEVMGRRSIGVMVVDYPGESLIARILRTNFGTAELIVDYRTKHQFEVFEQTSCQGQNLGFLDYPGPGGAISVSCPAPTKFDTTGTCPSGVVRSIRLHGPVSAGTRIMTGMGWSSFGTGDHVVITVLQDIPAEQAICIENLRNDSAVITPVYEQQFGGNHHSFLTGNDGPTSFRIDQPTNDTQSYYLSVTSSLQWTSRFHVKPSEALSGPIVGFSCLDHRCKTKTVLQSQTSQCIAASGDKQQPSSYWTFKSGQCADGSYVQSIKCPFKWCPLLKLIHCVPTSESCRVDSPSSLRSLGWTAKQEQFCPVGSVVTGVQCQQGFLMICRVLQLVYSKITFLGGRV